MPGTNPLRLAMWSGPRNISTAMMRSWGNRSDTAVCDEPLYAHYLVATGKEHPGRDEVIATGETDWRRVVAFLTGEVPGGKAVFFQKHMVHHLLPHIDRAWMADVASCFLIRHPREVLCSFYKVMPDLVEQDLGFLQQLEIFEWVRANLGTTPPVIDARDVLERPRAVLGALCDAVGLPFEERMLRWEPGPRPTDGVWARYWYHEVETSTGFRPWTPRTDQVPKRHQHVYERCRACYEALHAHRLH